MRFERHWRFASWALLDKSLILFFGLVFLLVVVRRLPPHEFGLQAIAAVLVLTLAQLLRALFLVPLTKFVAEGRRTRQVAITGALLYGGACGTVAVGLVLGRGAWAAVFSKPDLAAVLVPSGALLAAGSLRDASVAMLEGHRRLRQLFLLDLFYYALAIGGFLAWTALDGPRTAVAVQWIQAAAAGAGAVASFTAVRAAWWARPARDVAARILSFGRYALGSSLGDTIRMQADGLLVGALLETRAVAVYGAAKLAGRVLNVVAQAVNQVIMPLVSRLQADRRDDDLRVLFEKSVCFLFLALAPCVLLAELLAPWVFELFFRGKYADSVPVFRVLMLSALTLPLASVGSPFLVGLGRMRALLAITWLGMFVAVGTTLWWAPRFGPVGAAAAVLAAAVVGMVARTWVLQRILGFRLRDVAGRTRDVVAFARRRLARGAPPQHDRP